MKSMETANEVVSRPFVPSSSRGRSILAPPSTPCPTGGFFLLLSPTRCSVLPAAIGSMLLAAPCTACILGCSARLLRVWWLFFRRFEMVFGGDGWPRAASVHSSAPSLYTAYMCSLAWGFATAHLRTRKRRPRCRRNRGLRWTLGRLSIRFR